MTFSRGEPYLSSHVALKPSAIAGIATTVTIVWIVVYFLRFRSTRRKVLPIQKVTFDSVVKRTRYICSQAISSVRRRRVIRHYLNSPPVVWQGAFQGDINPWQLEYQPNPVIFSHLVMDLKDLSRCAVEKSLHESQTLPNHISEKMDRVSPIPSIQQTVFYSQFDSQTERWDSAKSTQDYTSPELSGKLTIPDHGDDLHGRQGPDYDENAWKTLDKEDNVSSSLQHNLSMPTLPLETPTQLATTRIHDQFYTCSVCCLEFSTAGLQRDHYNRKHSRRYICSLCNAAFNLRADLHRHERTVHKDESNSKTARKFTCPNASCTTPGKDYIRRDNFRRHVERCKRADKRA